MKRILLWLILAVVVLVSFVLYRSHSDSDLQVTPDAAGEIEKAKRRLSGQEQAQGRPGKRHDRKGDCLTVKEAMR